MQNTFFARPCIGQQIAIAGDGLGVYRLPRAFQSGKMGAITGEVGIGEMP